jgi:hypothetical protein
VNETIVLICRYSYRNNVAVWRICGKILQVYKTLVQNTRKFCTFHYSVQTGVRLVVAHTCEYAPYATAHTSPCRGDSGCARGTYVSRVQQCFAVGYLTPWISSDPTGKVSGLQKGKLNRNIVVYWSDENHQAALHAHHLTGFRINVWCDIRSNATGDPSFWIIG